MTAVTAAPGPAVGWCWCGVSEVCTTLLSGGIGRPTTLGGRAQETERVDVAEGGGGGAIGNIDPLVMIGPTGRGAHIEDCEGAETLVGSIILWPIICGGGGPARPAAVG